MDQTAPLRALPSVDDALACEPARLAADRHGRAKTVAAIRGALDEARRAIREHGAAAPSRETVAASAFAALERENVSRLRPVFNLTGTVLHTNLGRARLAEAAIEAAVVAMREAVTLEFDLGGGRRGERDDVVREMLAELTGAEDATLVNNNAAALMIALGTLAHGREAVVSRGELIEIGGAFRLPDIMARAGVLLREVGTTNRTHARDYAQAIGEATGLVLKVHTSNFVVQGFTASVEPRDLAAIARANNVPLLHDLGSGTLVDLRRWGLGHEPTVAESVAAGADLVTFSGDKLLGGPQAGFIVGRRDLIRRINANPMKRAMRVDKIRLAAIEATLRLYRDPDRLAQRLPTLRAIVRPQSEIAAVAARVTPAVSAALGDAFVVDVADCASEIGSGALPLSTLPSVAVRIRLVERSGGALETLLATLRSLPTPVIGRIAEGALLLDCRCLEDEAAFVSNLAKAS